MTEYLNEVKTVKVGDVCIGYTCRRSVVYGYNQEIPDYWLAATTLLAPEWNGGFKTKKAAREWLEQRQSIRARNAS